MAATHKKLASGQLAGSAASIYDPTSGKTGMVKTIILHNTNSTNEVVELYFNATTEATRLLKVTLVANETFEWTLGHMIVQLDAEVLYAASTTASKVNYFIFGAEE